MKIAEVAASALDKNINDVEYTEENQLWQKKR